MGRSYRIFCTFIFFFFSYSHEFLQRASNTRHIKHSRCRRDRQPKRIAIHGVPRKDSGSAGGANEPIARRASRSGAQQKERKPSVRQQKRAVEGGLQRGRPGNGNVDAMRRRQRKGESASCGRADRSFECPCLPLRRRARALSERDNGDNS